MAKVRSPVADSADTELVWERRVKASSVDPQRYGAGGREPMDGAPQTGAFTARTVRQEQFVADTTAAGLRPGSGSAAKLLRARSVGRKSMTACARWWMNHS